MKLEDINETVFQTLTPEVQNELISSIANMNMNDTFFVTIIVSSMLAFIYFSMKINTQG